jgi:hypothetical protein
MVLDVSLGFNAYLQVRHNIAGSGEFRYKLSGSSFLLSSSRDFQPNWNNVGYRTEWSGSDKEAICKGMEMGTQCIPGWEHKGALAKPAYPFCRVRAPATTGTAPSLASARPTARSGDRLTNL